MPWLQRRWDSATSVPDGLAAAEAVASASLENPDKPTQLLLEAIGVLQKSRVPSRKNLQTRVWKLRVCNRPRAQRDDDIVACPSKQHGSFNLWKQRLQALFRSRKALPRLHKQGGNFISRTDDA